MCRSSNGITYLFNERRFALSLFQNFAKILHYEDMHNAHAWFIAKRYLITVVADLSTEHGYKLVCDALKQMPDAIVKRVLEAKSEEKQSILKMTLESLLNK